MNEFIMHRHSANPLIKPEDFPVPADSVMNCGQAMYKGKTVLLVAAIYRGLVNGKKTGIHVAMSDNGIHFEIDPIPLCSGTDFGGDKMFYDCWVIDPRLTQIGDEYYICRPGEGAVGPCALLEKTTDFKTTEFLGCIALPPNRVPCIFPEKVNGRYVKLDRPFFGNGKGCGEIWISYSPDLKYWGDYKPLLNPGFAPQFDFKIGPTVPVKTSEGWLEIIHGTWDSCADTRYSIGAVLLDLNDPSKIIGHCKSWILTPQADYETTGHVRNVCFPCGCLVNEQKDEIRIYYGASDEFVCLATGTLSELIDACKRGL